MERVGLHDSFLDLGGHSLLAAQLVSRVAKAFDVELSLKSLLESPTVADMAGAIARGARTTYIPKDAVLDMGVRLSYRIPGNIVEFEGSNVPVAALDISLYRDDIRDRSRLIVRPTSIPVSIHERRVVLVDDVLYTGRTIRAAMDALNDFGRPQQIQLAILLDRGHRELPIRPDYVGQNIPTATDEQVKVRLEEIDGTDEVAIVRLGD